MAAGSIVEEGEGLNDGANTGCVELHKSQFVCNQLYLRCYTEAVGL